MDVRPPPPPPPQSQLQPLFRLHHDQIRYENVLRPPDFLPPPPPPNPHSFPPLQPQSHSSNIHHPYIPHREPLSPRRYPVIDRSHRFEFDPPPKPYFHPPPREIVPLRELHGFPERNHVFEDGIFNHGRIDEVRELHENWDRNLRLGFTEVRNRGVDVDVGGRDVISENFELYRKRGDDGSWDSDLNRRRDYEERRLNIGMDDRSRDLYRERYYDERRWDSGMNERIRDLYRERDCDKRRWDISMSGRSPDLYKGNLDERRWDSGMNSQGYELYCQVDDDERRWDSNRSAGVLSRLGNRQSEYAEDVPNLGGVLSRLGHRQPVFAEDVLSPSGVLSRLGNKQPKFGEGDLSLGRFSGRLGTGARNGEFNRPVKKKKFQKKKALNRILSGKVNSRHSGGFKSQQFAEDSSRGNLKGYENGCGKMQTELEGEREHSPVELAISFKSNALVARAIQVPSHPAVELCEKSKSAKKRLGSIVCVSENDTVSNLHNDSQGTSTGNQDEAVVSGSGSVAATNARDLGENIPKNDHMEVTNPKGLTMIRSGKTHSGRLRKRRRVTEQPFSEASLRMDNLDNIACKSFVPKLKKNNSSLKTSTGSLYISDNVIMKCSDSADGLVTTTEDADRVHQLRTDKVACHAHENLISNGNAGYDDSLKSNQHENNVNKYVHDKLDGVGELSFSGEAVLESSFLEGTSEDLVHIKDHDTGVPEAENYSSEIHEPVSSVNFDCVVMQKTEDAIVSDLDPQDANSEDVVPNRASKHQVLLDANYFKSLEGPAATGYSDIAFDVPVSSCTLSANYKETRPEFDVSFPNNVETRLSVDNSSPKVISDCGACLTIDTLSMVITKRKDRGDQLSLSDRKADVNVGTVRSVDGEDIRHSANNISPAMGGVSEKDSSKEDVSFKEGLSGFEDSPQEFYFNANGSFPGYQKKQKLSSPRSSLSSLSEDGLSMHSTRPSEFGDDQSEDTSSPLTTINKCGTTDLEGEIGVDSFVVTLVDGNKSHGDDGLALNAGGISCSDRNSLSASNSGDEQLASGFDMQSCITSPEELRVYSDLGFSGASACLSDSEMICRDESISKKKKSVIAVPNGSCVGKYVEAAFNKSQTNADIPLSLHKDTSRVVKKLYPVHGKKTWSRTQHPSAVTKVIPAQHPSCFSNTKNLYSSHVTKSRTWCRTGNYTVPVAEPKSQTSPAQINGTNAATSIQSSYIRKGNSLVRKPSPSHDTSPGFHGSNPSVYRFSPCINTMKNDMANNSKTGDVDAPALKRAGEASTSEMLKAPTVHHSGNSLNCTPCKLAEPLPARNPHNNGCASKALDGMDERIKASPALECQTDSVISSDKSTVEEGNSEKKIVYVKRKSYQLVVAYNSNDTSMSKLDNNQTQLSDGYYKSRGNQLVRASPENHVKIGNANANAPQAIISKTSARRQSGFPKTYRNSKFSFVWKLHDTQSSVKHKNFLGPRKILPYLFSHKRAYWRSFILGIKPSLSNISQKLPVSRKRGAIYTRSSHGYSLKMSKVLSVGGCSLKWSKSIEKNSKKANEDATRAVAAAEKRKKDEKGAVPIASKARNHVSRKLVLDVKLLPGERIFRIGSERYKMDATRRTLHRITEKESSSSVSLQSEKNVKRSYIPRRLLIGNEEYVRIGNGNQLVRDPKKRTRVLASEKVRWSLRTARLRLARKKKYCQFFTRFGKCNKDDGKCPYIHDPSKIVVCTKFLTGSCTNVNCKLTHEVIPERMQDCSYFLKGACSNDNCPYRHVHISPDSTVCESFLRGYCADGNKCPKKHTYVCPDFEATGVCPEASTCKLHHPKKKAEKKPESEQRIVRGRYFDGGLLEAIADCSATPTEKLSSEGKGKNIVVREGKFPDYISLDISEDETDHLTLVSEKASDEILPDTWTDD